MREITWRGVEGCFSGDKNILGLAQGRDQVFSLSKIGDQVFFIRSKGGQTFFFLLVIEGTRIFSCSEKGDQFF